MTVEQMLCFNRQPQKVFQQFARFRADRARG